ncbi:MAG: site-2 protease family protein [Coriobacteriales bacterium]|nr:site-2 protease family protein [Coriobacteriales bacterium]
MNIVITILTFIIILCTIVIIHEGGHAIVARLCGVRVTEFFVGMPWGPTLAKKSRRSGITYGFTLALLGGYTRIAGMGATGVTHDPRLSCVLAYTNRLGTVTVGMVAQDLEYSDEVTKQLLDTLCDWGSLEPVDALVRGKTSKLTTTYRTVPRDANGLTIRDRHHSKEQFAFTRAGDAFIPPIDDDLFFEQERHFTYVGVGYLKRVAIVLAGIFFNLVFALIACMLYFMLHGVPYIPSQIAEVDPLSEANAVGMLAGDEITAINGTAVNGYSEVSQALKNAHGTEQAQIDFIRNGETHTVYANLTNDTFGIMYQREQYHYSISEAFEVSVSIGVETAIQVASLLIPSRTAEVISNSSGIVGVATVTSQAAMTGIWEVMLLWALLSLSIALVNLLPFLPLDGGHFVIETIQAVIGHPISDTAKGMYALVGIALLVLLFIVLLFQDISRILPF